MAASLRPEEVDRIAALARLELSDDERRLFATQLSRILDYADQIRALDTTGVPPMTRVEAEAAFERPDEPRPSVPRDEAMAGAPEAAAGLFVVPKVI